MPKKSTTYRRAGDDDPVEDEEYWDADDGVADEPVVAQEPSVPQWLPLSV